MLVDVDTTEVWLIMSLITAQGSMFHSSVIQNCWQFFSKLLKFGRCLHDGSLISNDSPYGSRLICISVVSDPEELIIFFKLLKFGRCAHDESLIDNEPHYHSRLILYFSRQWSRTVVNFFQTSKIWSMCTRRKFNW